MNETDIIMKLASDIVTLYEVNPYTGEFLAHYRKLSASEANIRKNMSTGKCLYDNVEADINVVVNVEDRDRCHSFFSKQNLTDIFERGRSAETELRFMNFDIPVWFKFTVLPVSEDKNNPKVFVVSQNIDAEKRVAKLEADRIVMDTLQEKNNVLEFEDNFESIYDVDLNTGVYEAYVKEESFFGNANDNLAPKGDFFSDTLKNVGKLVYPPDRDMLIGVLNGDYIRDVLKKEKQGDWYYRLVVDNNPVWFRMSAVYKNEEKQKVIIAIFNAEEEMNERRKNENLREELVNQMLGGESLYIVDVRTDEYKTLHRNQYLSERYGTDEKYSESIRKYIDSDVHELDREKMYRQATVSSIVERLRTEKEVTEIYRDISSGVSRHYRMCAVKLSEKELLIGFSDYDDEYIRSIIHEKLEEDYFAILVADLETALVKVTKKSKWYEIADTGQILPYATWINDLTENFDGETKSFFTKLADIEFLRTELSKENKIAFTYKSPLVNGGSWVQAEIMVLTRLEDGTPALVNFGFRMLDALGSEKHELQVKLEEAFEIIKTEKNRYDILHEIIHSGHWSFKLNKNDKILSVDFSESLRQIINNDLKHEPNYWRTIVHPEDRTAVFAAFEATIADHSGRTLFDVNYRMIDRYGKYNWFRSAGKVVRHADGSGEFFGIHVNINDRIEEEKEQQHQFEAAEQTRQFLKKLTARFEVVFRIDRVDNSFKVLKTDEYIANDLSICRNADELKEMFISNIVFEPDRERVRQEFEYNFARRKTFTNRVNSFTIEYRSVYKGVVRWNELRIIYIDENTYVVGVAFKNRAIILRNLAREENADYFALYAVDLDSGQLQIVKQSPWDDTWDEGASIPYEAVLKNLAFRNVGETSYFYKRLTDLNYVRQWFANEEEKFSYSYEANIGDEKKWVTVTARVIIRHTDGTPSVFMLGYSFMDMIARDNFEMQKRLEENMEMIGGLATGYLALYYFNMDEDVFKVYSIDETRLPDTKKFLQEKSGWEALYRFCNSDAVHPVDRKLFAEINSETIRAKLAHSKKFTIRFRRNFAGKYLWSEMDVVKCESIDERANVVIIGFAERDAEIRSEKEHEENFARRVAISDFFIKSYSLAYYCNISTDTIRVLHVDERTKYSIGRKPATYSEAVARYIVENVHPKDSEKLRRFLDPKNIKKQLAENESVSMIYVAVSNAGTGSYRCAIIRGEDENHICVGFRNVTGEVKKQQEEQAQLQQAREVRELIERVMKDNRATFVVNAVTDTYHSMQSYRKGLDIFGTDPSFTRTFEKYANNVYEADREWLRDVLRLKNIRERMKKENNFSVRYRNVVDSFTCWFELRFFKLSNENFMMAISDVTKETVTDLTREAISQNSYGIFLIDLCTDTVRVVKRSGRHNGEADSTVYRFTEIQSTYINNLAEKHRVLWQGLDTIEGVRALLRSEDKREMVYESSYQGNKLVRATWHVIERINGEAGTVCISFVELDEEQADREKLHEQIAQQLETIGGVASEYTSLYHVNLLTGEYTPYSISEKIADIREVIARNQKFGIMLNEFIESDRVLPEFRGQMHEFYPGESEVRELLAGKKKIATIFKRNYSGNILWTEGNIIKCEDINEPACMAVVGFKEVDDEVRNRIEQQKQLESAVKRAEEANESKTRFLFNMSHDIRTPMNAIKGFTAMAHKYMDDKERLTDYLEKIDVSGQQLLSLINQVLEMSRIESGKVELDNKPVNIKDTYEQMIVVLGEQANVNGLEFHHSFCDMKHYNVLVDEVRIGQITLNIVGNALKYTPKGGRIDFTLQEKPCEREGWARYTLIVADNGIGMSQEYLKVLFDPFTREKSSTVSHIQGTGLGMSIVKHIVEIMGGKIEVQSELGKGTRFDITIDLQIAEDIVTEAEGAAAVINTTSFNGKRVLLVEDNELNREIARDILEEFDLTVEEAGDGDEAVEMVKKVASRGEYNYYDIILMDVQMPRMNGYEATKIIRELEIPVKERLPIIAMTANAFEEDRKNAIAAGMDGHLAKPIEIDRLIKTLSEYL